MAEQTVELQPGESKVVSFEAMPREAKVYRVSVDGLMGSFRAIEVPVVGWINPTSHSDPDGEWLREEQAYDGDTVTWAQATTRYVGWAPFLILYVNENYIDKIKFMAWASQPSVDIIDIDVYYTNSWHHVYEGAFEWNIWIEKAILGDAKFISKIRFRCHNSGPYSEAGYLREVQLHRIS